jgi:catechol 2,3-dioxygenase-like lactoylglutathione lyase family enzyme
MQLDHINIATPRELMEQVRAFYVDILGFEDGPRPGFSRPGYWLYREGKPQIHLIESDRHARHDPPGYLDNVAFRSTGAAELLERLDSAGVEYRESYIAEHAMTQLFFFDPAGIRVEINFPGEAL